MSAIGDLIFRLLADGSTLERDVKREAAKAGDAGGKTLGSRLSKGLKQGLSQGLGIGAGVGIVGLVAGATTAISGFIGSAIEKASSLNESASKAKVIFGDAVVAVEDFASKSAKSLGISKQAALEAAATFGNLFTGLGKSKAEAAEMSTRLVGLSADLASFNNLDPTDVLDKLRAGLAGESEPLRRLGVFLTEAKVKAKAMELGLADAHGELSEGAKLQARYALILQETTTAQGDFARTSDGLANQQRIAAARVDDAMARIGSAFLTVATHAAPVLADALETVASGFNDIVKAAGDIERESKGPLRKFGELVSGILHPLKSPGEVAAAAADKVARSFKGIPTNLRNEITPKISGAATAAAEALYKPFAGAGDKMVQAVTESLDEILDALTGARNKFTKAATDAADAIFGPQIARANLAATERELAEQQQVASSKKSTAAQVLDAKNRIIELNKTKIEQLSILATYGDKAARDTLLAWAKTTLATQSASVDQIAAAKNVIEAFDEWSDAAATLRSRLAAIAGLSRNQIIANFSQSPTGFVPESMVGVSGNAYGGPIQAGEASWVGELGKELFVPSVPGVILPHTESMALASGAGAGDTYNITVALPSTARPDPFETARQLRRLSEMGVLTVARR